MLQEYMTEINKIDYDKRNDILYVIFANDKGESYCEELTDGIEEMIDMMTETPTGIMVYYPHRDLEQRQKELNEIGLKLNLAEICC